MPIRLRLLVPVLVVAWLAPCRADDDTPDLLDPHSKTYAEHMANVEKFSTFRPSNALYAAIHALIVDPSGTGAMIALAKRWPDRQALLAREAYRRHRDRARIADRIAELLGAPVPAIRTFGAATRVEALYLGHSVYDNVFRGRSLASVDVGETLDPQRLVVQGLDSAGDLVPIDAAYEADGGLAVEVDPATQHVRIVARTASQKATLTVRDRKGGASAVIEMAVIGVPAKVVPMVSRDQGRTSIAAEDLRHMPGDMLHMRVKMYDVAGNSVWRHRLVWTATGTDDVQLRHFFARRYSWMHLEVNYEMHVNTLFVAPEEPYRGPVKITVIEPDSGASGIVTTTLVSRDGAAPDTPLGALAWAADLPTGQAKARADGKPLLVWFHSRWCPGCHRIAKTTLSDPAVVALSSQFVSVQLDADVIENQTRVMVMRVADLPSVVFFSPTGTRLFELPYANRFDAERFQESMRQAMADAATSRLAEDLILATYRASPTSLEVSDALAKFYTDGFRFEEAGAQAMHGYQLAQQAGATDLDRRMSDLVFYEMKLRRFDRAAEAIQTFTAQFPTSPLRERVQYYRGLQTFYGAQDLDSAAKIWEEQLNEFPTGQWARTGRKMLDHSHNLQRDRAKLGEDFPMEWGGK